MGFTADGGPRIIYMQCKSTLQYHGIYIIDPNPKMLEIIHKLQMKEFDDLYNIIQR